MALLQHFQASTMDLRQPKSILGLHSATLFLNGKWRGNIHLSYRSIAKITERMFEKIHHSKSTMDARDDYNDDICVQHLLM